MKYIQSFIELVGRLCIAAVFVLSGAGKIFSWNDTATYMASNGIEMVQPLLFLAICVEVFGGIFVAFGYHTKFSAWILALYLIPVTYFFHHFWDAQGQDRILIQIEFLKNLAIFGGLLVLGSTSDGMCRIDHWIGKGKAKE